MLKKNNYMLFLRNTSYIQGDNIESKNMEKDISCKH